MLTEYFYLFIFSIIILIIIFLLPLLSTTLVYQNNYQEKVSAYECGFEPFEDTLQQFEIRYYLVAILFLIFDLEIAYIMPWVVNLNNFSLTAILTMFVFFFFLVLGFYYEWLKGGLEWD